MIKDLSLGIDTSNYKTSVAIVDQHGEIIFNFQKYLDVKEGKRGLRQSEAFFQHVQTLPSIIEEALSDMKITGRIAAVSASSRPRPIEGSYMPVFTAGTGAGKIISASLGVPYFEFSHQEGHIEAIKYFSCLNNTLPIICFHFSGGTSEAIFIGEDSNSYKIIGGTKDISYGQVLDRIGVAMGLQFPCGEAMDNMAINSQGHRHLLTKIKVNDGFVNLSGLETQCQKLVGDIPPMEIADNLFSELSKSIMEMTLQLSRKYNIKDFIYAGGVSCSQFMRNYLVENLCKDLNIVFGKPALSSDNAIGIALLGGKNIWQ